MLKLTLIALVAQRIEQSRPKGKITVQFCSRVPDEEGFLASVYFENGWEFLAALRLCRSFFDVSAGYPGRNYLPAGSGGRADIRGRRGY